MSSTTRVGWPASENPAAPAADVWSPVPGAVQYPVGTPCWCSLTGVLPGGAKLTSGSSPAETASGTGSLVMSLAGGIVTGRRAVKVTGRSEPGLAAAPD